MGIEAYPALTDTERGRALPNEAPSPYVFNHSIVKVRYHGKTYWLEPTRSHEGGRFPDLAGVSYAWALPIEAGQKNLEKIPAPAAPQPTYRTVERYELPAVSGSPLSLRVATTYLDSDADWMRGNIADKSQARIEQEYLDFYAGYYPGLKPVQPVRFVDDRDANRVLVYESYSLPAKVLHKNKLDQSFPVRASSLDDYDDKPDYGRNTPFGISFPLNKRQTIILVTPGHRPPVPDPASIDGAGFKYRFSASRKADTLTLDYSLIGTTDTISPTEIGRYRRDVDKVRDANYWELDLTAVPDTDAVAFGGTTAGQGLVLSLALIAAAAIVFYALYLGLHADDDYAETGFCYPVPLQKFLLMSIATAGLYAFFWAWKCWRWLKHHDKREILPFWRTCFSVFWLYPLFDDVNSRLGASALPNAIGAAGAVLFLFWTIAVEVFNLLHPSPLFGVLSAVFTPVFFLPIFFAVNKLNAADSVPARENAKITGLTLIAVLVGILNWSLLLGIGMTEKVVRLTS